MKASTWFIDRSRSRLAVGLLLSLGLCLPAPLSLARVRPHRPRAQGDAIQKWEAVFRYELTQALGRDPTPAELEWQARAIEQILARYVKRVQVDGDGHEQEVPTTRADFQKIKMMEFHAIRMDRAQFAIPDEVRDLILCTEKNFCLIPEIEERDSWVDVDFEKRIFIRIPESHPRPSVRCPKFKKRFLGGATLSVPVPVFDRKSDSTLIFGLREIRGVYGIETGTLRHLEFVKSINGE